MARTRFIEGPAGTGKTTYAIGDLRRLLDNGVRPEQILILLPQRSAGWPYEHAFTASDWPDGAQIDLVTIGGLARRGLEIFWPLVAEKAGFAYPEAEPQFLNVETAQYYMWRFVNEAVQTGVFDSVNITPFRIMTQVLDNLSKAAINGFALDDVTERLVTAWGDRHSSRPPVYHAAQHVAERFRAYCLENNLLDFSLQIDLLVNYLLDEALYREFFQQNYRHLIVDNLEEHTPVTRDVIRWAWDDLDSALLLYDTDAGYRVFLGADPGGGLELKARCDEAEAWEQPYNLPPTLGTLAHELGTLLDADRPRSFPAGENPRAGFTLEFCQFYPEMLEWAVNQVAALVQHGVPPGEIVVLAPLLGDSLRFALTTRLHERGIRTVSHRPSRAVRDEPAARAVLTLMALAHPDWNVHPPLLDVANALQQVIEELDPVRAWLLAQIVYRPGRIELGTFDAILLAAQERITYRAGEKYERLRRWLAVYQDEDAGTMPPDHFLSRLFGEVLSQPGFGFHTNLDAGRVVAELVESARRFRQTLYPRAEDVTDWIDISREYYELVQAGLLAGTYVASWQQVEQDAVFLAPAYTFLMRNRRVSYQFWLDIGSNAWWERLEQPLTHPYVLARGYPHDQMWTDEQEYFSRRDTLRRLMVGLVRRCQEHIYIGISNLSEQGFEQRGPLLQTFQQIIQRYDQLEEVP